MKRESRFDRKTQVSVHKNGRDDIGPAAESDQLCGVGTGDLRRTSSGEVVPMVSFRLCHQSQTI